MLYYSLVENPLEGAKGRCRGVVKNLTVHDEDEILQDMAVPGGVTRSQAKAVLQCFNEALCRSVKEGHGVNTELFKLYPVIKGIFEDCDDCFDRRRHSLALDMRPGAALTEALQSAKVKKRSAAKRRPCIDAYFHLSPVKKGEPFLPGDYLVLAGLLLKLDVDDPEQGLFFISGNTRTRAEVYVETSDSRLVCALPETLAPGSYDIVVGAVPHGNRRALFSVPVTDFVVSQPL